MSFPYVHVDVFSPRPYSGNSLAVFPDAAGFTASQMGAVTRELRHFESIFLQADGGEHAWRARVFDLMGELGFAGHPVIGAACVLHASRGGEGVERWVLRLNARTVTVETAREGPRAFSAVLDQGRADFLNEPAPATWREIASWFSLEAADLDPRCPPEVVSTGLRYLVLPVRTQALARARVVIPDLEARLAALEAEFAYLVDLERLEARHWNNDGVLEDVATGSGAGCAAAWLRRHGRLADGETAILRQGRFTGRPSEILIRAHGAGRSVHSVEVGGAVALVGRGELDALPDAPP